MPTCDTEHRVCSTGHKLLVKALLCIPHNVVSQLARLHMYFNPFVDACHYVNVVQTKEQHQGFKKNYTSVGQPTRLITIMAIMSDLREII